MPKFWVKPLATIDQYRISFNRNTIVLRKVTCDNLFRNGGKFSHHIQLHEKWYPNSIKQKY